jgi:hypothetical protein
VGLRLTGDVLPEGKPTPETLEAWAADGRITVERSAMG